MFSFNEILADMGRPKYILESSRNGHYDTIPDFLRSMGMWSWTTGKEIATVDVLLGSPSWICSDPIRHKTNEILPRNRELAS